MFNYFFDGEPEAFQINSDNLNLKEVLENHYPHILKEVEKERYIFDYPHYDIFKELKYHDQIVGFITFQKFHLSDNVFDLTEAYIIPKFRGKNILYKSLHQALINDNFDLFIRRPNIAFLKVLRKNHLTYKVDKDLHISFIKFTFEIDDMFKNDNISKFFKKPYDESPYKGHIFDFNLSSTLCVDPMKNFLKKDDILAGTKPREYDLKKYKLEEKLEKVDEDYLEMRLILSVLTREEFVDFEERFEKIILKSIRVEKILGKEKKLSKNFKKDLRQHNLSDSDGVKILNHITDALEKDQLSKKSYIRRVNYLLENFEDVDKTIDEYSERIEVCPFCGKPIPDFVNSCSFCGLKIREHDFELYAGFKYIGFKKMFKRMIKSKVYRLFRR